MYQAIKKAALAFHASFRSSAVILIARINVAVGSLFTVMLTLSPDQLGALHPALKDPRVATVWIIVNGFISEYARRRPGSRDPV